MEEEMECSSSGSSSSTDDDSQPKDSPEGYGKSLHDAAAMFTRSRKRSVHVKRIEPNAVQETTAQVAEETVQKEARMHDAQGFHLVDDDARKEDLHRINIALHTSTHGTFLFLSNDKWRWAWEGLLLLVACYYALIVPVKIVYSNSYLGDYVLTVEIPTTLILVFDIFLQFNTSYSQNGTMVTNKAAIRRHYFTTWFIPELLASAPFDLVLYVLLRDAETEPAFKCLSALRLIRVCTLQRVFMDNDAESLSMAQVWITYLAAPLLRLVVWVVLCIHWLSLLRVYLLWDDSESEAALTGGRNYLTAMYWVTYTLTTVGYGDIMVRKPSERILAIVLFVTGALLNAATIGGVAQMLSRSNAKNERNDNMRATLALLRHYNVSAVLAEETLSFKQHQLKSFGANAHAVLRDLPPELSEDIGVYIKVKFIALAPIFDAASAECRTELAKALRPECAPLHTTIVSEGEEATDMYFLAHGFADQVLVCEDRSMSRILKKGDFFGEASLLLGRSESTVHALTYCELYTLSKDDFRFILEEFPDFCNIMQERIKAAEEEIKHFARADLDFSSAAGRRQSTASRTGWVSRPRWSDSAELAAVSSLGSRPAAIQTGDTSEASQQRKPSKAGFRNMLNRPPALATATASNAMHNAHRDSADSSSWLGMKRAVDLIDEIAASPRVGRKQSRDAPPTRKIVRPSTRMPPLPARPAERERACVTDELLSPSATSVATAWSLFAGSPRAASVAAPVVSSQHRHDTHDILDNHSSSQTKPDIVALLAASQQTIMAAIEASEDRIRAEFISLLRSPVPVGDPILGQ